MSAHCKSCHAPIEWVVTESGRRMPLDIESTTAGNLIVVDGVARAPRIGEEAPFLQRISHFATCPKAAEHRKAR